MYTDSVFTYLLVHVFNRASSQIPWTPTPLATCLPPAHPRLFQKCSGKGTGFSRGALLPLNNTFKSPRVLIAVFDVVRHTEIVLLFLVVFSTYLSKCYSHIFYDNVLRHRLSNHRKTNPKHYS